MGGCRHPLLEDAAAVDLQAWIEEYGEAVGDQVRALPHGVEQPSVEPTFQEEPGAPDGIGVRRRSIAEVPPIVVEEAHSIRRRQPNERPGARRRE